MQQIEEVKNEIVNKNYTKENIIIRTENVIVQLSNLEEQKNQEEDDISNIDLGDCENKLRLIYDIPEEESLIIYKTDLKKEGFKSTYVAYEVYDPLSLQQLNLSVCNNIEITINVPVEINIDIQVLSDSLSNYGYNLFDKDDPFYQDICAKYTTINGTDILLSDRKKDIYNVNQNQNESICQNKCDIKSYNSKNKKAQCNCLVDINSVAEVSSIDNIENLFNAKFIEEKFFNTLSMSNFRILKCYKLVFIFTDLKNNIGQILMSIAILIFIILLIIYFTKDSYKIRKYIDFILELKRNNGSIQKKKTFSIKNKLKLSNKKKKFSKSSKSNLFGNISDKKYKKKLSQRKGHAPTKKKNNNNSKNKKDAKNNSIRPINNNILLNVQVIKPKIKKKKNSIFSPDIIANKKKINRHKSMKSINCGSYTKKYLNMDYSPKLFKSKEKFDRREYRVLNDYEINNLEYEIALEIDKRKYIQYYWSLLKQKQLILFTFFPQNDYNLLSIKILLFLISFSLFFTINGLFFDDKTMHNNYKNNGSYDFINKIPQLIYSTIITAFINILLKRLSLSQYRILEIKEEKDYFRIMEKSKKIESNLKINITIFFFISFIFMIFFWYFISCFCAIFPNTQIILIKDTTYTFILSSFYPFLINLIPGIFRISSLRSKKADKECLYKFGNIIALI